MGQAALPGLTAPEEAAAAVAAVTRERVCAAAAGVQLDAVYLLKAEDGEEEAGENG